MVHIKVTQGIDLPLDGAPNRPNKQGASEEAAVQFRHIFPTSEQGLMLDGYGVDRYKLLVKEGDKLRKAQAVASVKDQPHIVFSAPCSGTVKEILRGAKRRIRGVIFQRDEEQVSLACEAPINFSDRRALIEYICSSGLMPLIKQRPFNILPTIDPINSSEEAFKDALPRDIFVSAVISSPYQVDEQTQLQGHWQDFYKGLEVLSHLTTGEVHLTHRIDAQAELLQAPFCSHHTIEGPHPIGNVSVHIHHIKPIRSAKEIVWTLDIGGVITLGHMFNTGSLLTERRVALCGEGLLSERRCVVETEVGIRLSDLLSGSYSQEHIRIIHGDPLTGVRAEPGECLAMGSTSVTALKESEHRQMLHFFRLGLNKYSTHRGYISSMLRSLFKCDTNQHGEARAFIDGEIYDRVMPMRIPTMHLVKAILCEDFERAEELGLLEVAPEDFALATYICPCKIEMSDIVAKGLRFWSKELMS